MSKMSKDGLRGIARAPRQNCNAKNTWFYSVEYSNINDICVLFYGSTVCCLWFLTGLVSMTLLNKSMALIVSLEINLAPT